MRPNPAGRQSHLQRGESPCGGSRDPSGFQGGRRRERTSNRAPQSGWQHLDRTDARTVPVFAVTVDLGRRACSLFWLDSTGGRVLLVETSVRFGTPSFGVVFVAGCAGFRTEEFPSRLLAASMGCRVRPGACSRLDSACVSRSITACVRCAIAPYREVAGGNICSVVVHRGCNANVSLGIARFRGVSWRLSRHQVSRRSSTRSRARLMFCRLSF